jgi:hypothetical protein
LAVECLTLCVRNYPEESLAALLEALLRGYFELHEIPQPQLTAMNALALEGVGRVGGLTSLAIARQATGLKLTLAGTGGQVVEMELGTAPVTPTC